MIKPLGLQSMSVCFITPCNNEAVLQSSLLASPALEGAEVSVQRAAASASQAHNRGIATTRAEVMVFMHQDVYLPPGWMDQFRSALALLDRKDPSWGVLGLFGAERSGKGQGIIDSTGLQRMIGSRFEGVREVETLDEVMLVIRRSSGLRFDESFSGFHLSKGRTFVWRPAGGVGRAMRWQRSASTTRWECESCRKNSGTAISTPAASGGASFP